MKNSTSGIYGFTTHYSNKNLATDKQLKIVNTHRGFLACPLSRSREVWNNFVKSENDVIQ
jgi:hypothetical protein